MPMLERNHSNLRIKALITACGVPPVLRKSNKAPSFNVWRASCANKIFKSGFRLKFSFGHSAFGAGVTVTIVEASNVGVKVGMVGRGVIVAVGVSVGIDVFVFVGIGDGVAVALSIGTGAV